MDLRSRLTLFNTFIVGGVLLLFGTAIYLAASLALTNQVDNALAGAANQIFRYIRVNQGGELKDGHVARAGFVDGCVLPGLGTRFKVEVLFIKSWQPF